MKTIGAFGASGCQKDQALGLWARGSQELSQQTAHGMANNDGFLVEFHPVEKIFDIVANRLGSNFFTRGFTGLVIGQRWREYVTTLGGKIICNGAQRLAGAPHAVEKNDFGQIKLMGKVLRGMLYRIDTSQ